MPTKNLSTTRQLNNLIEFRQTVYEQILTKGRDAQTCFDVILARVHRERAKPPAPLWLGYRPAPATTRA